MPVELSPDEVRSALARLGEHEAPRDVEAALEWIAGRKDPESPIRISRYGLQVFLWYEYDRDLGSARRQLTLTPAGHEALRLGLRSRALEPAGRE